MNRLSSLALVFLAVSSAVACNSSSGSDTSAVAEMACAMDAQIYCDKRKTCWPDGVNDFRFQRDWGTVQTCMDQRKASCVLDVQRKFSGVTALRVEGCARALQSQSCPDFVAGIALPTSSCPPVVGMIDDGAACVAGNQCKSNYCDRAEDQLCGKCADKGGIGAACDQSADCAGGLSCQPTADMLSHTCEMPVPAAPKGKAGEACGGVLPACDTGLTCVGTGTMKTCMAQLTTAAAPCDPTRKMLPDCESATNHLYCNKSTMTCEARKFVPAGQPCNELPDGSFAMCSGGANCVRPKDPTTMARPAAGTCAADVGPGQRCWRDGADGPGCAPPLRCVYDAVGAPSGTCLGQDYALCGKPLPAHDAGATD